MKSLLQRCFLLQKEFISEAEEALLVGELSRKLKSMRWSDGHFDDKICNYREFCISDLTAYPVLNDVIQTRIAALMEGRKLLPIHILELRKDGYIKPHIDNHNYSGKIIAGLSLKQDSLLTLSDPKNPSNSCSILLPRRSFYRQM